MKTTRFTFCILLAVAIWGTGCITHGSNPIEGWKVCFSQDPNKLNKAIMDDYQDYILKLPPEERKYIGPVQFFEDGTGKHAVRIEIALNGTDWAHVLIYDRNDKRIKTMKYASGSYRS